MRWCLKWIISISDMMPLTCFLDIAGCVAEHISPKYTNILPFLRNLFTTSTKEDVREIASVIYAIITVNTSEKAAIDKEIKEFVGQAVGNKLLEAQCGYLSAFAHLCERCVVLAKKGKFGGKAFNVAEWEPYQEGAVCLGKLNTRVICKLETILYIHHFDFIRSLLI